MVGNRVWARAPRAVRWNSPGARGTSYTQIVYGPQGSKLALMNGQALSKAFVPLPGGATAVYNSSGLAYYRHVDWLGSSRFASTPTAPAGMYYDGAYAPYGENYAEAGTTDRSFTTQNQDTVGDLYDFMFREHHPNQGRWLSPDPIGGDITNPQSLNRYAYVLNNPTNFIDSLGLDAFIFCVPSQAVQSGYPDDPHIETLPGNCFIVGSISNSGSGGDGGSTPPPPAPTWLKPPPAPWELWEPLPCSDLFTLDDQPYDVTDDFGAPRPQGPHLGMDFSAPEGTPIRVRFEGEVRESRPAQGFGNVVVVQKTLQPVPGVSIPVYYSFGHGTPQVATGRTVRSGTEIMQVGSQGRSSGPHVDVRKSPASVFQGPFLKACTP